MVVKFLALICSFSLLFPSLILLSSKPLLGADTTNKPMIIAHRGASGYLPEHTLAAKALAHAMNADFIEQDVVMTKDNQLIVFHDLVLQHKTDVAQKFPDKKRSDNNYHVIDFTLAEIRQLNLVPNADETERFPFINHALQIPTLVEEIEFIQGLNQTRSTQVGLYIEIKGPSAHYQQGKDITSALFNLLVARQTALVDTPLFIQSFEADALIILRQKLEQENWDIPLVQLLADNHWQQAYQNADAKSQPYNVDRLQKETGLQDISNYAQGVGINIKHVFADDCSFQSGKRWIQQAQNNGLVVHAYTFRRDKLPSCIRNFQHLHQLFFSELSVDGIFTDYPDVSAHYRDNG